MTEKWYVVKNGEIVCTCDSEAEAMEIINNDKNGDLEAYPASARVCS